MICPYCHFEDTKVIDKRDSEDSSVSRRRRECIKCAKRFTTYEKVESLSIKVVKSDGAMQNYDRAKLLRGIMISAEKRLPDEQIERIVDDIELRILNRKSSKISASDIGRMILTRLKSLDKIAYMRFASVFLEFDDLDQFKNELKKLE